MGKRRDRDTGTVLTIQEVAYHRNGIGGTGFNVVRFTSDKDEMLGIVFPQTSNIAVLLLNGLDGLDNRAISSARNAWRGDNFERALRAAVEKHNKKERARLRRTP